MPDLFLPAASRAAVCGARRFVAGARAAAPAKATKGNSAAAPVHRFVALEPEVKIVGLRGPSPFPPSYIDVASLRKRGDEITFLQLKLGWVYSFGPKGQSATLNLSLEHESYSCAWGTIQTLTPTPSISTFWVNADLRSILQRACSGQRQDVSGALPSAEAVHDFEIGKASQSGDPTAPPQVLVPLPPVVHPGSPKAAVPPPRMPVLGAGDAHRIIALSPLGRGARTVFIDWSSVKRTGETVSALSLAVLGSEDERHEGWGAGAELRLTDYACANRTMQVEKREEWSSTGEVQWIGPRRPRTAVCYPILDMANELAAACGKPCAASSSTPSIQPGTSRAASGRRPGRSIGNSIVSGRPSQRANFVAALGAATLCSPQERPKRAV